MAAYDEYLFTRETFSPSPTTILRYYEQILFRFYIENNANDIVVVLYCENQHPCWIEDLFEIRDGGSLIFSVFTYFSFFRVVTMIIKKNTYACVLIVNEIWFRWAFHFFYLIIRGIFLASRLLWSCRECSCDSTCFIVFVQWRRLFYEIFSTIWKFPLIRLRCWRKIISLALNSCGTHTLPSDSRYMCEMKSSAW